jgi:hypothetical protein
MEHVLAGLGLLALGGYGLWRLIRSLRALRAGDERALFKLPVAVGDRIPEVPRTYWAFALWAMPLLAGVMLGGVPVLVGTNAGVLTSAARVVGIAALACLLAVPFLVWGHVVVVLWNQPRWLVPPRYRGQGGIIHEHRSRRTRAVAGRPPTDHEVEVHPLGATATRPPGWAAVCAADGCGWMSFADATGGAGMDEPIRRVVAGHTTRAPKLVAAPSPVEDQPS